MMLCLFIILEDPCLFRFVMKDCKFSQMGELAMAPNNCNIPDLP